MQPNEDDSKEKPKFYAFDRLNEAVQKMKQTVDELPDMRKKLGVLMDGNKAKAKEKYTEIQQSIQQLSLNLTQINLSLQEMEEEEQAAFSVKLQLSVKTFNPLTPDYSKFCGVFQSYLTKLEAMHHTTNAACIGRLMNRVKMGYYPTDLEHVEHLVRGIAFPSGITTNLFDPCCGCGLALRKLADGNNCFTFGCELDEGRAEDAQARLHRVAIGSYFYARISNEAMHAVLLNPPYIPVIDPSGGYVRAEKRFLVESIDRVMMGGLLMYIIPYYRLTLDVCRFISDHFTDVTVWKFYGDEFKRFKQVVVMGKRRKRENGIEQAGILAELALTPEKIPELIELPDGRYELPAILKKVELFKGAEFNVTELASQLKTSQSFSRLFAKSKLDTMNKRPLLPLNIGQIGLIGGSGLINGLIDCEHPHIIKGRIVKETRTKETEKTTDDGRVIGKEVSEVTSNKMVFNLLTPLGFQSLT